MSESILVVGAGIAGLCTALALGPTGRSLTLLERDGDPPSGDADDAFTSWNRKGVGHLRQSHAFLARLGRIIATEHPQLRQDLLDLGVRELGFEGMLTPLQKKTYRPDPCDADFTILTSRRTTLELVIRRYVGRMPNVSIRSGAFVRSLVTQKSDTGAVHVKGLVIDGEAGPETLNADLVIDAAGKSGALIEQLIDEGAPIRETAENAGILYFTRHYRMHPGQTEPAAEDRPPATGDMGYLKFGVFPADNNCFSITFCVPEIEYEMRKAIVRPETWDKVVDSIPGLRIWTDSARSAPVSKVFGMGDLISRWRDMAPDGKAAVTGYLALGDNLIRTNPLYGRGCSLAAVETLALRETLDETSDPAARTIDFQRRVEAEIRPYYDSMQKQDRAAIRRAEQLLTPGYRPKLKTRILRSFIEDGVGPAMRFDVGLLREAIRGFHMLEHPDAWLKRPRNMIRILMIWARGKTRNAAGYPPKPGPDRVEMMTALGLDPTADIALLAQSRAGA